MLNSDLILLGAAGFTAALYRLFFKYFPAVLLDHPNQRSSHSVSRSRAGGLIFGIAWLAIASFSLTAGFSLTGEYSGRIGPGISDAGNVGSWWLLVGAGIIWLNGLLDDFLQVPAKYRIIGQALGVAAGILGPEEFRQALHPFLLFLVWIGLVYFINVFNFMDGTDGLAGSQSVFIILAAFLIGVSGLAFQILAVTVAVFLFWNLPRARLFMGDSGSNLLGYVVGILLLQVFLVSPPLAFLLPLPFTVDTTLTLVIRIYRGQKFYEAHREHAYQHLAMRYGHFVLLGIFGTLNLALLVLALWLTRSESLYLTVTLVFLCHMAAIWFFYTVGAGRPKADF